MIHEITHARLHFPRILEALPSSGTNRKQRPRAWPRVVYRVNGTGDYRTLANNLYTSKNYTLAASPTALGLASKPARHKNHVHLWAGPDGFSYMEQPMIYLPNPDSGSSSVNVAGVGEIGEAVTTLTD